MNWIKLNYYHHHHHHHHPCYHLYTGYLQLYNWNNPRHYYIQCYSCSVFTVCATCNVISHVKCSVPLHQHFPQSVCSAQYGCFLQFLNFVFSRHVTVRVILIWFQSPLYYYYYYYNYYHHHHHHHPLYARYLYIYYRDKPCP